jgi:hypothetical protein
MANWPGMQIQPALDLGTWRTHATMPLYLSADTCSQDQCNSGGENGKQGGLYGDDCAGYWITMVDN